MKQHITIDQLSELSDKGKERLREWWKPSVGDCFVLENTDTTPKSLDNYILVFATIDMRQRSKIGLPLLSSGQMIEFLEKNTDFTIERRAESWYDEEGVEMNIWYINGDSSATEDLCDALWEAVKEMFEKL